MPQTRVLILVVLYSTVALFGGGCDRARHDDESSESVPDTTQKERAGLTVRGIIGHDGRPLGDYSETPPRISIGTYDLDGHYTSLSDVPVEYEHPGLFAIRGLRPGRRYSVYVEADVDKSNPPRFANDFEGSGRFDLTVSNRSEEVRVDLLRMIHLQKPVDNNVNVHKSWTDTSEPMVLAPPIRFSWTPFGPGVSYDCYVTRWSKHSSIEDTFRLETTNDWLLVNGLPPSRPEEHYEFGILAKRASERIGTLRIHRESAFRDELVFVVQEPGGETRSSGAATVADALVSSCGRGDEVSRHEPHTAKTAPEVLEVDPDVGISGVPWGARPEDACRVIGDPSGKLNTEASTVLLYGPSIMLVFVSNALDRVYYEKYLPYFLSYELSQTNPKRLRLVCGVESGMELSAFNELGLKQDEQMGSRYQLASKSARVVLSFNTTRFGDGRESHWLARIDVQRLAVANKAVDNDEK